MKWSDYDKTAEQLEWEALIRKFKRRAAMAIARRIASNVWQSLPSFLTWTVAIPAFCLLFWLAVISSLGMLRG